MEPINIDYFHVFSSGAHIFANTSNHRNPSTPRESSCFATQIMLWIFSLISTPSMSNHHLKLTTCHLHPITVGIIDDSWFLCTLFRSAYLCEYLKSSKSEHTIEKLVFRYRNHVVDVFSHLHSFLLPHACEVQYAKFQTLNSSIFLLKHFQANRSLIRTHSNAPHKRDIWCKFGGAMNFS